VKDRLSVFVNDVPVEVYQGMKVRHALIALGQDFYEECVKGESVVKNEDGFLVGLDGALSEGIRLYTRPGEKKHDP
jgi:hypothetical protein